MVRYLLLKLWRDVRQSKGQYVAITLVIMLGVAFYVGMMSATTSVQRNIDRFYEQQKLADLWVTGVHTSQAQLDSIRGLAGVEAVDGRAALTATNGDHSFVVHTITTQPTVNIPAMDSGRLPAGADECIVDRAYAAANHLSVGSTLDVTIGQAAYHLRVSGVFNSPEYLYLAPDITSQPDHQTYGALFVSPSLTAGLPVNEIVIKATPGTDLTALTNEVRQIALPTGAGVVLERDQLLSWSMLNQDITQDGQLGKVFPIIFFLVASAIILISMSKTVETQRNQIGNLKALGIGDGLITTHFLGYTLLTCLAGSALGVLAGIFGVMPGFEMIFTSFYTMPPLPATGFGINIVVAVALALFFGVAATLLSVRKPLRERPAEAMRPKPPHQTRPILLERNAKLWARWPFGRKIVLRNLFLNKGRALLSSIGIIGCVGLLFASFAFLSCIKNVLTDKFYEMSQYDISVMMQHAAAPGTAFAVPVDGVATAWGTGTEPASLQLAGQTIGTNLDVLQSGCGAIALYGSDGRRVNLPDDGVIVPQLYAQKYGVAIGDTLHLTLSPIGGIPQSVPVRVADVALQYLTQDVYASFDYMTSVGQTVPVTGYYLRVTAGVDAQTLASQLGHDEDVAQAMTRDDLANSWSSEMSIMNSLMSVMIVASAVLSLTVVYNISMINIFERRRDIATLKVLGYRRPEVNRLVFQENLIITGFGSVLGIGAGVGMLWFMLHAVISDTMYVPMLIPWTAIVYAIALGFGFTLLANQMLRGKINRIDMVESLKSVE